MYVYFYFYFLFFILFYYLLTIILRALPDSNRRLYFKVLVFKTSAINQTRPSTLIACYIACKPICFNFNTIFSRLPSVTFRLPSVTFGYPSVTFGYLRLPSVTFGYPSVTFLFLYFYVTLIYLFYLWLFYFILYTFIIISPWLINKLSILITPGEKN